MSSPNQDAGLSGSENTPLLADHDAHAQGEGSPQPPNTSDDLDDPVSGDVLTPKSRIALLSLLVATLCFSFMAMGLAIAVVTMMYYAREQFGIWDYTMDGARAFWIVVLGLLGIIHAIYNIIRLSKFGLAKLPSMRILIFICAVLSVGAVMILSEYLDPDNWYCSKDSLDGPWYPGTWEQCKKWETAYIALCWTLVVSLGLNAILCFAFIITAFSIARDQRNSGSQRNAGFWDFNLSPGSFSFELKVRWGRDDSRQH